MCDEFAPLEKLIPCRCLGIRKLFRSFDEPPSRSLEFLNRLTEIEALAKKQPHESSRILETLLLELAGAADGMGGAILTGERFEKFIACHDDVNQPNPGAAWHP
jgi:hypothetical protein